MKRSIGAIVCATAGLLVGAAGCKSQAANPPGAAAPAPGGGGAAQSAAAQAPAGGGTATGAAAGGLDARIQSIQNNPHIPAQAKERMIAGMRQGAGLPAR